MRRPPQATLFVTSPRVLLVAGLYQFVTYACFFNITPLNPEIARDLGLDAGALGSLVGIGGIVSLLAQIPGGSGGDRWGRRPFFAAALGLLLLSQLARWQAETPTLLLVAQILGGAAQGIATVNAWALVADAASVAPGGSASRSGQAFGILNAALSLGLVAGYLFAGAVGGVVGWRLMSLAMAALPVLAVPALAWIPPRQTGRGQPRPGLKAVVRSTLDRQRLALTVMAALILGAGQGALYLLPFGLQQRDLGPFTAAVLLVPYVVGSVIAGPLGGRLSDQLGGSRPVILTQLAFGVLACLGLIWGASNSLLLVLWFVLIGAAVNGALPLLAARIISLGDPSGVGVGTIIAGLRMGQSSGTFVGPALAGLVLARAGLNAGWLAEAACLAASLALHELVPSHAAIPSTRQAASGRAEP